MKTRAYYNENDPKAAAWLRELIKRGLIPAGDVDDRSIRSVAPADLHGYQQCHFFAGIGGWAYALMLADFGSQPVWTGSCPCQPFSVAGQQRGITDDRHLWPDWFRLIRECRPPIVFGEQVASPAGLAWFDAVCADLEGAGYACGAADLCAAGVGAPHIRQRLYFVALAEQPRPCGALEAASVSHRHGKAERLPERNSSNPMPVAHALSAGRPEGWAIPGRGSATRGGEPHLVAHTIGSGRHHGRGRDTGCAATSEGRETSFGSGYRKPAEEHGAVSSLAVPLRPERGAVPEGRANVEYGADAGGEEAAGGCAVGSQVRDFWRRADWLPCRDGKARPVEPGTFPLAHGLPARVVRLRGYGNAIVPQVAAEFIKASLGWENNQ